MNFKFAHNNLNVFDLQKSLEFYEKALGLKEVRRKEKEDGSFILVYLGDGQTPHQLELTWLRDMDRPYNLGDNEIHLFPWTTLRRPMRSIRRWGASVLRIRPWGSILSRIRTGTGWRSYRKESKGSWRWISRRGKRSRR